MNLQLRALIDRSKFHQGAVREVAALLPDDDEKLDALVAETIASGDQLGFILGSGEGSRFATFAVDVTSAPLRARTGVVAADGSVLRPAPFCEPLSVCSATTQCPANVGNGVLGSATRGSPTWTRPL